jgi:IMP dehydrogenase/GMP reductase
MFDRISYQGITFDDVLLEPGYSDVVPAEVDVRTQLTRNIILNVPIVSSPMDTVTESDLAIALAQEGGIGIIHKNMSVQLQTREVDKVKRSENGIITDPIQLPPEETVGAARKIMEQHKISGVPITTGGKLRGILTRRDLRFLTDSSLLISEVMTKENLVTAAEDTTLVEAEKILTKNKVEKLLLVDDQYRLRGLITIKDIDKQTKVLSKEALQKRIDEWQKQMVELQQVFLEYNKELEKKQKEMTDPIFEKVMGIVKRLASTEGYDVVLDKATVAFVRTDLDLTDRCIQLVNGGAAPAPGPTPAPGPAAPPKK